MLKQFFFQLFIPLWLFSCTGNQTEKTEAPKDSLTISQDSVSAKTPTHKDVKRPELNYPTLGDSLTYLYLSGLPSLPLPFKISTQERLPATHTNSIPEYIVEKTAQMGHPYGKLMEKNLYAVVVHTLPADAMLLPVIYTIDYNGKVIISMRLNL